MCFCPKPLSSPATSKLNRFISRVIYEADIRADAACRSARSPAAIKKKDDHKAFYVRQRLSGIMTVANVHSLADQHMVNVEENNGTRSHHADVIWVNLQWTEVLILLMTKICLSL